MPKERNSKITTKKHLARVERERQQTRYLLIGTIVVAVIVLAVIIYGILDQSVLRQYKTVAQVGSDKVTLSEFQTAVKFNRVLYNRQLASYLSDPFLMQFYASQVQQMLTTINTPTTIGQQTLDSLVEDKLIEQEAKARGITVTDAEVEDQLQNAFGYYAKGTPTTAPTETPYSTATLDPTQQSWVPATETPAPTATSEPMTATPTATAGPTETPTLTPTTGPTVTPQPTATLMNLDGYKSALKTLVDEGVPAGLNEAVVRNFIRTQLLKKKLTEALTKDLPKEEEQVWARHILVATEAEAKAVLDRLNKGEDFAKIAKELSTDTSNKDKGGDLGWFGPGQMVSEFEKAAYALKVGEISQPVKTTYGYHIIQLLGRQIHPYTASEYDQAKSKAFSDWLTKAKTDKKVQEFDVWKDYVPVIPTVAPQVQEALNQLQALQQQQQQQQLQVETPTP
jgi:peptidyl-prolyl cis-trans isomerase D